MLSWLQFSSAHCVIFTLRIRRNDLKIFLLKSYTYLLEIDSSTANNPYSISLHVQETRSEAGGRLLNFSVPKHIIPAESLLISSVK